MRNRLRPGLCQGRLTEQATSQSRGTTAVSLALSCHFAGLSTSANGTAVSQTMQFLLEGFGKGSVLQNKLLKYGKVRKGTPPYMAPELMSAEHPELARPAVDVYSFGVVLHYIITGEESDRRSMARAIRVPEECPASVAALVESCLQDDPNQRPAASEIVSALEKIS